MIMFRRTLGIAGFSTGSLIIGVLGFGLGKKDLTPQPGLELLYYGSQTEFSLSSTWASLSEYVSQGEPREINPGVLHYPMKRVAEDRLEVSPDELERALAGLTRLPKGLHHAYPKDNRLLMRIDTLGGEIDFRPAFGERNAKGPGKMRVVERAWPMEFGFSRNEVPPQESFLFVVPEEKGNQSNFDMQPAGLGIVRVDHEGRVEFSPLGSVVTGLDQESDRKLAIARDSNGFLWLWYE